MTEIEKKALQATKLDMKIADDMDSGKYTKPQDHPDYLKLDKLMRELAPHPIPNLPTPAKTGRPAGWNSDSDEGETYFANGKMKVIRKGGDRNVESDSGSSSDSDSGKGLNVGYKAENANGLGHIYPISHEAILKMLSCCPK
jgi:hypothetical protein